MIQVLVYALMFFDYRIGILSISDWAIIALLFCTIIKEPKLYFFSNVKNAVLFMLFGIFLSVVLNICNEYFSLADFTISIIKLFLYVIAVFNIPRYLIQKNIDMYNNLKKFLFVAVFGAFIQYLIVMVFSRSSWPLYSLGGNFFGLITEETMFNNVGMMRARSFWSEPAHYAISISLIFILLVYYEKNKLSKFWHVIYIVGIMSANSMSGYGIMIAIYAIYFLKFRTVNYMIRNIFMGIALVGGAISLIVSNEYLRGRLVNLFALKDHSGVVRTIGGFYILKEIPWYGVGIGNHANFYKTLRGLNDVWFSGSGEFYNNILLAIITMGYIGAVGFLLFEYSILKENKKIFMAFMVTHFGWGKLFTTPIWVFLILYIVLKNTSKCENEVIKMEVLEND